jgi:hypothetical protein
MVYPVRPSWNNQKIRGREIRPEATARINSRTPRKRMMKGKLQEGEILCRLPPLSGGPEDEEQEDVEMEGA